MHKKRWLFFFLIFTYLLLPVGCSQQQADQAATPSIEPSPTETATSSSVPSTSLEKKEPPSPEADNREEAGKPPSKQPVKPTAGSNSPTAEVNSSPHVDPKPAVNSSPAAPPSSPAPALSQPEMERKQTVELTIVGDQTRGVVLAKTEIALEGEQTVLDVLKKATREHGIQLEYSGAKSAAYVEGIDNLYEFDKGPKSGWVFRVNGTFAGQSAGSFPVKSGDQIEWFYTEDMGKDVGIGVSP